MPAAPRPLADVSPSTPDQIGILSQLSATPAPREEASPAAGLEAARSLLAEGRTEAAQRLLRQVPRRGRTRADRVAITIEAAQADPEFVAEVAGADAARDAGDWPRAERQYQRALRLYPLHAGYMVQYGHVLKEQGKLPEAEVAYRSARALGAPPQDVDEHIRFVQAVQERDAPLPPLPPLSAGPAAYPLDLPPTRDDVEALLALLLRREEPGILDLLQILRSAATCRDAALYLIRRDAFRPANRALLALLAEAG